MSKTAWMFPGQGSQKVGMETDLQEIPAASMKFELADRFLGWSVLELCADSQRLSQTLYTQPCLYVIECILADLLLERGHFPQLVAGHSLGEFAALYAGRAYDFDVGLKLVKQRAELMHASAEGTMAAVMKFDRARLEALIAATPDAVIANDNSEMQVVISGSPAAVASICEQVKAKRVKPLNVSGAFHSPLMQDAADRFAAVLESIPFGNTLFPVLSNTNPVPTQQGSELKARLQRQMSHPVRWREIMLRLPQEGVTQAVEIGPGDVLKGLLTRTVTEIEVKNISKASDLDNLLS